MVITGKSHGKNGKLDVSQRQIQHESAVGVPVAVDIGVRGFFSSGFGIDECCRNDIVERIACVTIEGYGPVFFGNEIHVTDV